MSAFGASGLAVDAMQLTVWASFGCRHRLLTTTCVSESGIGSRPLGKMADGLTHRRAVLATIPLSGAICYLYSGDPVAAILGALGGILGVVVEPDLDVDHRTASEKLMTKLFGPIGWAWGYYWMPYAKLMPHRSLWSHAPLLGTAVRWAYMFGPFVLFWLLLNEYYLLDNSLIVYYFTFVFVGNCIADWFHYALDYF